MNPTFRKLLKAGVIGPKSYRFADTDAEAYVNLVKAAGVTDAHLASLSMPSWAVIEPAIDSFFVAEKAASRWADLGMLYLPIWGIAAANAICLVARTSLSFLGTNTHARGYWQPNGTTGYADTSRTPASINQTVASASLFALLTQAGSGTGARTIAQSFNSLSQVHELQHSSTSNRLDFINMSTTAPGLVNVNVTRASQNGILIGSRQGGNRSIYKRGNGGFSSLVSTAGADAGTLPTGTIKFGRSDFGGGAAYNDGRYGAMGASVGWTQARSQAFSSSLETLWETCTGLTLPT